MDAIQQIEAMERKVHRLIYLVRKSYEEGFNAREMFEEGELIDSWESSDTRKELERERYEYR